MQTLTPMTTKLKPLRVLLVEDNAMDAHLLREMFSKESADTFTLTHLTRMSDAEVVLAQGNQDIVLLDMGLPDGHGLETLRRARAAAPNVAMVVLTGLEDEDVAADAMKEGAQDYLIKGQIENRALPRALRHALERHRMQAEAESMRQHQLELRDQFLSHVSHELRSPLTSIYSFNTIIADGLAGDTSEQQNEYLRIIARNVRQLQAMIEDLLEVTQAQAGKLSIDLRPISLVDSIAYAVDTLQGVAIEKEIRLSSTNSANLPMVYADETRVRQVLTILLDNAIKFTPPGGAVLVDARVYTHAANMLVIEVADTGCGISPEAAEHVFEHLYQVTDPSIDPGRAGRKGLGLGLHIAKELVLRHGGDIWVTSEAQQGSHFFFTLPSYSLAGLIAPILAQEKGHDKTAGDAIAVLTVEIDTRHGSLEVPRRAVEAARAVVQQCLRPDSDVLLPRLGPATDHKLSFVVARTGEKGAQIMGRRILAQFERHEELRPEDFRFAVSHHFMAAPVTHSGDPPDAYVNQVVAGIEQHISQIYLQERTL